MYNRHIRNNSGKISFVLVHLGKKPIPSYLWDCIRQVRYFNDNDIYLIVNMYNIGIDIQIIKKNRVKIVWAETLKKIDEHVQYRKKTSNKWFWRFTTERFYYIYELMEKWNLKDIVHIENDNLIYGHIDDYYEQFRRLNNDKLIGVTRDSNTRCIGGIIYIPNKESLKNYLAYITENPQLNDMQSLSRYLETKNCNYLPVIYKEYLRNYSLVNKQGEYLNLKYDIAGQADVFGAIFDAAALGQYIGGIDKIHDQSDTRGFINETACYDPSKMCCKWITEEGNRVPIIIIKGNRYRVINLHIHSKELNKYMSCINEVD